MKRKEHITFRIISKIRLAGLLLIASIVWDSGVAQPGAILTFNDNEALHIRWSVMPGSESYDVFIDPGSGWQKVNDEPVGLITDNRRIRDLLGYKADILMGMLGAESPDSDLDPALFLRMTQQTEPLKLIEVISLVNPELATVLGLTYTIPENTLPENFRVAVRPAGGESVDFWAISANIDRNIRQQVPPVDNLTGKGLNRAVLLQWRRDAGSSASGNVVSYHVFRSENELGPFQRINYYGVIPGLVNSAENSDKDRQEYVDNGLENGRRYFYQVRAANAFGIESLQSTSIEVEVGGDLVPPVPSGVAVRKLGNAAGIYWDKTENGGIEISRSTEPDKNYQTIFPAAGSSGTISPPYPDFSIEPGMVYYYRLRSITASGQSSDYSEPVMFVNFDKTAPAPPLNVTATADDNGKVTISWNGSPESDVVGYEVERATDNDLNRSFLLNPSYLTDTFYTDEHLVTSQTTYGYIVFAIDRSQNRSQPSEMAKVRLPDVVPPQPPFILNLESVGDSVYIGWSKAIEPDIAGYKIYRKQGRLGNLISIGQTELNAYSDVVPEKDTWIYAVSALDEDGNESEYSVPLSITVKPSPFPEPPKQGAIRLESGIVFISWLKSDDKTVIGYLISRYNGNNPDRQDIKEIDSDEPLVFHDRYVIKGSEYTYEIRSFDASFNYSKPLTLSIKVE